MDKIHKDQLEIYKALAGESRLKILVMLQSKDMTINEIYKKLNINYTLTSQHLTKLEVVGLIEKVKKPNESTLIKTKIKLNTDGTFSWK